MPLQHGEFIEYMQRVGYRSNSAGICFGLAHMGVQAILCEDLSSFKKHLQDIEEDIENNDKLGSLMAEEDIRKKPWMTEVEIQKLTDIRAFCDGVELYFQPRCYKNLFLEDARPFLHDAMKTSPLIDSSKMTEQQGLYQAASISGVYEEQDLVKLLKLLKEIMSNDLNKPIALEISSIGHSICIGRIPNIKQWVFIDANCLPPKWLSEEALARKIKRSLRNTEKIILTANIYSTKNNQDAVDNIISDWRNNEIYQRIHAVTPEKARYVNKRKETWLHHAARVGDLRLTKELLKEGPNIDATGKNTPTALIQAAQECHLEVLMELIHHGANVDVRESGGRTALMVASYYGHLEVVNALIHYGANVNAIDAEGRTALMVALQNGCLEVAKELIHHGANVDAIDDYGWSTLMLAAFYGRVEVVNVLIAKGVSVEKQYYHGMNALIVASQEGHLEVVKALIHHSTNIDVIDADGWTPLMLAVRHGHVEVVSVLIANGANVHMKDKDGNSALTLATPELREAMLKQIETQNKAVLRKKLTFSNARVEEIDSDASSSHNPPTSKP